MSATEARPLYSVLLPLDAETPAQTLTFFVAGKPQTAGSKRPIAFRRRDGSIGARAVEGQNHEHEERKKAWRSDLRDAAREAAELRGWTMPPPDAALGMEVWIIRKRTGTHLGTGRNTGLVKDSHRGRRPTTRPDSIKVIRAAEDALTGVVIRDDAAIVEHAVHKVFADHLGHDVYDEGLLIELRVL